MISLIKQLVMCHMMHNSHQISLSVSIIQEVPEDSSCV